jgi:hypothetical protein
LGDANCDGRITATDVPAVVIRFRSTFRPVCGADVNNDGKVDAEDVDGTIFEIFGP